MINFARRLLLEYLISDKRIKRRLSYQISGSTPKVSVVMPIHNQSKIIVGNIESIIDNMSLPFELIFIEDSSEDGTRQVLDDYFSKLKISDYPLINGLKYFSSDVPIFETKADSFGISNAIGEYILEIQADMKILEYRFDQKMIDTLNFDESLFALSARGTHSLNEISHSFLLAQASLKFDMKGILFNSFKLTKKRIRRNSMKTLEGRNQATRAFDAQVIFPNREEFAESMRAGWLGHAIDELRESVDFSLKSELEAHAKRIWVGETVMRGPILFRRAEYIQYGGFDTTSFFLGNDDHDLFSRLSKRGKNVAFTPIHFSAPLVNGSERAHKTVRNLFWREIHRWVRANNLRHSHLYRYSLGEI